MPTVVFQQKSAPIFEGDDWEIPMVPRPWCFGQSRNFDWKCEVIASHQNIDISFTVGFLTFAQLIKTNTLLGSMFTNVIHDAPGHSNRWPACWSLSTNGTLRVMKTCFFKHTLDSGKMLCYACCLHLMCFYPLLAHTNMISSFSFRMHFRPLFLFTTAVIVSIALIIYIALHIYMKVFFAKAWTTWLFSIRLRWLEFEGPIHDIAHENPREVCVHTVTSQSDIFASLCTLERRSSPIIAANPDQRWSEDRVYIWKGEHGGTNYTTSFYIYIYSHPKSRSNYIR